MSSAWVYQRSRDLRDAGPEKAPWWCGWYEPDGRRKAKCCGEGFHGKKTAEKLKRKLEAELMTGTYQMHTTKLWPDFRKEYERRVLEGLSAHSRLTANVSLDHFERIIKPVRVFAINTGHIDDFIAVRREERGRRKGDTISPASVNKDLRHVKAALALAVEWGYLSRPPRFRMEREPGRLPTYVTGDHFALIYGACGHARLPADVPNVPAADWWRGLLVTAYMTGWRIAQLLALRREDVDLESGLVLTRWQDNKGKRDQRVRLHPVVLDHLRRLTGFAPTMFPWNHNGRTLYDEFARLQRAAGIHLPCGESHEHTAFCHVYGFHDLRRAFATLNADKLTPDALQALMQHKSYQTTQKYINMARQMDEAVASLHVPEVLRKKGVI